VEAYSAYILIQALREADMNVAFWATLATTTYRFSSADVVPYVTFGKTKVENT